MSSESSQAFQRRLPALLAAVGLLSSIALEVVHARAYLDPSATSFCSVGARFDCSTVALSRLSVVLGVPLPIWGVAGFAAMGLAAWWGSALLVPLAALASLASLALLVAELTSIGSVCLLCEVVHVVCWALFAVAWRRRASLAPVTGPVLMRVAGAPAALIAVTWLGLPPYWSVFSWKAGVHLPHGVDADGRQWIGAELPRVTVHEYVDYACPHCAVSAGRMRQMLADHPKALRVVRHQFPRMPCMRIGRLLHCQPARVSICAGKQGKFWEADSWLFEHAPGRGSVDVKVAARELTLDATKLEACVQDPATFAAADAENRAARKARILEAPTYVIDGKKLGAAEITLELQKRL